VPLDDDPLTSPSFPAINTSDSRSYRTRGRSSSSGAGQQDTASSGGGYGQPARQLPGYPASPDRPASAPNGYPVTPAAAALPAPGAHSPAPAANPYGSYVSASQPSYPDVAASHRDTAAYGSGYAAGQQAAAAVNWYSDATDQGQATGYLPAPGHSNGALPAGGGQGYGVPGQNGYSPADYGAGYPAPGYQNGQHSAPAGYSQPGYPGGQYDQRGYPGPGAGYGQDGYDGYPGYGGAHSNGAHSNGAHSNGAH
jgi:hypothetical protein